MSIHNDSSIPSVVVYPSTTTTTSTSNPSIPTTQRKKNVNIKVVGAVIFAITYGIFCFFWALTARNNFWLMFIPLVTALWMATMYMYVRCAGLYGQCYTCRLCTHDCVAYTPYVFFGMLAAGVIIFSVFGISELRRTAQTSWSWSQDTVIAVTSNQTWNVLNVDNCYGPNMKFQDINDMITNEWMFVSDYKQFSFGLISQRQLTFMLNRLIVPGEQWKATLSCTSAMQEDVPVPNIKLLTPGNRVGQLLITDTYRTYSDMMFISLIILFGLQLFLWVWYSCWQYYEYAPRSVHWFHLFHGWPRGKAYKLADDPQQQDLPIPPTTTTTTAGGPAPIMMMMPPGVGVVQSPLTSVLSPIPSSMELTSTKNGLLVPASTTTTTTVSSPPPAVMMATSPPVMMMTESSPGSTTTLRSVPLRRASHYDADPDDSYEDS